MAIEDKYLDEGLFSGIKNTINDIKEFFEDAKKYQRQFDAIAGVGKQEKTEEELDLMLQICTEMQKQCKSKYMKSLLDKFITEIEKQQTKLKH